MAEEKPVMDADFCAEKAEDAVDDIIKKLGELEDGKSTMDLLDELLDEADHDFSELLAKSTADEQTRSDLKEEFAWSLAKELDDRLASVNDQEGFEFHKSQFLQWLPADTDAAREAEEKLDPDLGLAGEVHWCLAASMAAYAIRADLRSSKAAAKELKDYINGEIAKKRPFEVVHVVCNDDVAPLAVFSRDDGANKVFYVAVRGSSTCNDWWRNFQAGLIPKDAFGEGVKVHNGFNKSFQELFDELEREGIITLLIEQMNLNNGVKVVFCGHSLGGVVAQMLAVAFARKKRESTAGYMSNLVTFGCPRGGNAAYQAAAATFVRHVRVFTKKDPVRTLPSNASIAAKIIQFSDEYAPHESSETVRHVCVVDHKEAEIMPDDKKPPKFRSLLPIIFYSNYYHLAYHYASGLLSHFGIPLKEKPDQ